MNYFPQGTATPFARAVAAEVRALMAARRLKLRPFAEQAGFKSHNYVAIRLRDEKPFTLDDVERICEFFKEDTTTLLTRAYNDHEARIWEELAEATGGEVMPFRPRGAAD